MEYEPNIELESIAIINQEDLDGIVASIEDQASSDTITINLDYEGELVLPDIISINHKNLVIRGRGKDVTTIVVKDGFGFKDDCIIGVMGNAGSDDESETPVSVKISDLTIKSRVSRSVYDAVDKKHLLSLGATQ